LPRDFDINVAAPTLGLISNVNLLPGPGWSLSVLRDNSIFAFSPGSNNKSVTSLALKVLSGLTASLFFCP